MMVEKRIILNFHGIGVPWADLPDDEKPYWVSVDFWNGILDCIVAQRQAGLDIMITFDDGNLSDLDIALPGLLERGLKAQFFVLTGRIGQPRYLSIDHIQALMAAGMMIGLHGRDHINWRLADDTTLLAETGQARQDLQSMTGSVIDEVGIPFGAYNRRVIGRLKRAGFQKIYTSDGGAAYPHHRVQPRNSVRSDMTYHMIEDILTDRVPFKPRLRRLISTSLRQHIL